MKKPDFRFENLTIVEDRPDLVKKPWTNDVQTFIAAIGIDEKAGRNLAEEYYRAQGSVSGKVPVAFFVAHGYIPDSEKQTPDEYTERHPLVLKCEGVSFLDEMRFKDKRFFVAIEGFIESPFYGIVGKRDF